MRKLTESDLDRRVAETRERYDDAFDEFEAACVANRCAQGRKPCPTPGACVIPLNTSLLARAARWLANLRLKGPL